MKFKKDPQRKNKKRNQPAKKVRFIAHTIKLNESHVNPGTNRVELNIVLRDDQGASYAIVNGEKVLPEDLTMFYPRPGKSPKQLLRFEDTGTSQDFGKLLKKYDVVVAVDTNSGHAAGDLYHVGFAIQAVLSYESKEIIDAVPLNKIFVLKGEVEKPENRNIKQLIEFLLSRDYSKVSMQLDKMKFAIITDSDLGNIPAYNKRKLPLIEDYFLPGNFELIYASDASSDTIFNELIKFCHKGSSILFEEVRKENGF